MTTENDSGLALWSFVIVVLKNLHNLVLRLYGTFKPQKCKK